MVRLAAKPLAFTAVVLTFLCPTVSKADRQGAERSDPVTLKDEQGRIVRVEEGDRVTTYDYDDLGRRAKTEHSLFGTTIYTYKANTQGPFARILSQEQTNAAGAWKLRTVYDPQGERALLLMNVDSELLSGVLDRLEPYFWPDGLNSRGIDSLEPVYGKDFASISNTPEKDGGDTQITQIFGRRMEIRTRLEGDRRIVSDDFGGERVETWLNSGRTLTEVRDEHGPLLQAYLDPHGRPERVIVGGGTVILYNYDRETGALIEKHVADMRSDEILGSWRLADTFTRLTEAPPARRTALAFLPASIPIAEWDDGPLREGAILVTRLGKPYALIPFEKEGMLWRSVSTHFRGITVVDRIDYTADRIRILLSLGPAPYALGSEVVIVLERERMYFSGSGLDL